VGFGDDGGHHAECDEGELGGDVESWGIWKGGGR
jgi:hypothetical protein